jgi:hypothetical protein
MVRRDLSPMYVVFSFPSVIRIPTERVQAAVNTPSRTPCRRPNQWPQKNGGSWSSRVLKSASSSSWFWKQSAPSSLHFKTDSD